MGSTAFTGFTFYFFLLKLKFDAMLSEQLTASLNIDKKQNIIEVQLEKR
jgi:hypothetical protein